MVVLLVAGIQKRGADKINLETSPSSAVALLRRVEKQKVEILPFPLPKNGLAYPNVIWDNNEVRDTFFDNRKLWEGRRSEFLTAKYAENANGDRIPGRRTGSFAWFGYFAVCQVLYIAV